MKIYSDSHGIRIVGLTCVACSRYGKPPQNNVRLPFVPTSLIHLGRISPHGLSQTNLVRKCLSTSALHTVPFCLRGTWWLYRVALQKMNELAELASQAAMNNVSISFTQAHVAIL